MSLDRHTDSKRAGQRVERCVIDGIDELEPATAEDAHHDAQTNAPLSPSDSLPFSDICVVKTDTPIEIKSAMVTISSGSNQSNGRFYFREKQRDWLLKHGGVYLFAVCEPTPQRNILARKIIPASIVDELRNNWCRPEDRAAYDQLAWSRLFDDRELGDGSKDSIKRSAVYQSGGGDSVE